MREIVRSSGTNIFLAKMWAPLLCILGASVAFNRGSVARSLFAMSPFVILALFGLSVAIVEVRDGILRYRRLFKWRTIARHDIIGVRIEAPPVIGSVRLNKLLFPWGRLYFALDRNMSRKPFGEGEYPLLNYIRDNKVPIKENEPSAPSPERNHGM